MRNLHLLLSSLRHRSAFFLAVRLAAALGTGLFCTDDGQDHDGGHIGDHLEELIRECVVDQLQTDLKSVAETEEQAGDQNASGIPASEDNGGQSNEASAGNVSVYIGP